MLICRAETGLNHVKDRVSLHDNLLDGEGFGGREAGWVIEEGERGHG